MPQAQNAKQKIFGSTASKAQFGSYKLGNPVYSNDINTLQQLPAYDAGWDEALTTQNVDDGQGHAIEVPNVPSRQEEDGLNFILSNNVAFIQEEGSGLTYNANVIYNKNATVRDENGIKYLSLIAQNNNPLTDPNSWTLDVDDSRLGTLEFKKFPDGITPPSILNFSNGPKGFLCSNQIINSTQAPTLFKFYATLGFNATSILLKENGRVLSAYKTDKTVGQQEGAETIKITRDYLPAEGIEFGNLIHDGVRTKDSDNIKPWENISDTRGTFKTCNMGKGFPMPIMQPTIWLPLYLIAW